METDEPAGGVSAGSPQGADALAEQLGLFLDARPLAGYPEILSQLVGAIVEAAALGAGSRVYSRQAAQRLGMGLGAGSAHQHAGMLAKADHCLPTCRLQACTGWDKPGQNTFCLR